MTRPRSKPSLRFAAALVWLASAAHASAQPQQLDTLKDVFAKLYSCWQPPPYSRADPMDITVVVSFNRGGAILGQPRITYESGNPSENDRIAYRIAVMETLQRCTPLSFTEGLGGAVAGRPFAVTFRTRKRPPKPEEKRAWLIQKIL
ncbi:hypothetical protein ACH79_34105 [Bradyrhizobium sp. CCBAU 051011]|uniref:hypothetical protein n=1 Tax=Bradyrhizobium sp. CCBAU 051011 TaxID=858422 RepID=UPI0013738B45|nr:hypothetical protein [Bradyrhizobium sp. CCBAU 051011]QHO76927.1 hypothetical protein ACH79_34105 [Bradyrhizobium sp. CCBAU 051011]